jgi:hypothetical protein
MGLLAAICLVAAFFTFFFLFRTLHCLRRRQLLKAGGTGIGSFVSATIAGAGAMLFFAYVSYGRLTEEILVSRIEFRRISPEEYQARVMIADQEDRFFILRGNEWQMDAKIVTWQPPMTILGLDPIYRLDRLSGRYAKIDRERHEARTVHTLAAEGLTDIWTFARRFPVLAPGVDAHYGTATYVPMADGARYEVTLSRDALIARPANDKAREAVGNWSP